MLVNNFVKLFFIFIQTATLLYQTKLDVGCIMFIGTPRGAYISILRVYLQVGIQGIPKNIVGIFSSEIQPDSGLHGLWGFSGVCIYSIQDTPRGTRIGCTQKIFVQYLLEVLVCRMALLIDLRSKSRKFIGQPQAPQKFSQNFYLVTA